MTFAEIFEINKEKSMQFEEMLQLPFGFLDRDIADINIGELSEVDASDDLIQLDALDFELLETFRALPEDKQEAVFVLIRLMVFFNK